MNKKNGENSKKQEPKQAKGKGKKKPVSKAKQRHARVAMVFFVICLLALMFIFGWIGYVSAYIYPLVFGSPASASTDTVIT